MSLRVLATLTLFICCLAPHAHTQDLGIPDTLKHGCNVLSLYEHQGADTFSFPLYIFSDDSLESVTTVICYNVGSVDFVSADLGQVFYNTQSSSFVVTADPDQDVFALTWIAPPGLPLPPLNRTEIFATLYFTSSNGCPGDLEIDTCWLFPVGSTEFAPPGRQAYSPRSFEGFFGTGCGIIGCVGVEDSNVFDETLVRSLSATTHPNPFNSGTSIEITTTRTGTLNITIYDILGRRVRTIIDETVSSGSHQFLWDGTGESGRYVASGVYFMRVAAADGNSTRKLVLLR
ncbi:MAG: FlgD immunoglobulin-like domain containing protein [Candidatus Zixiibacteriota bacterium]